MEKENQGGAIIPMEIEVDGNSVRFTNSSYDIDYRAEVDGDQMSGSFTQFGNRIPGLVLTRNP